MTKATIKTHYKSERGGESHEGCAYQVVEEFERFVCLDIEGKKVDFGKSEVILSQERNDFL